MLVLVAAVRSETDEDEDGPAELWVHGALLAVGRRTGRSSRALRLGLVAVCAVGWAAVAAIEQREMTARRRQAAQVAVLLMLSVAAQAVAPTLTPAPEPVGRRVAASREPTVCECDLCGSKGVASPPDGKVNVHDILKFLMHMHAGEGKPMAVDDHPCDVNRDTVVDVSDLLLMFKRFGGTCAEHAEANWHGVHFGGDWNPLHLFDKPGDAGL